MFTHGPHLFHLAVKKRMIVQYVISTSDLNPFYKNSPDFIPVKLYLSCHFVLETGLDRLSLL